MANTLAQGCGKRWLMLAALAGVVLLAAGCGRRDNSPVARAEKNSARNDGSTAARTEVGGEQGQTVNVDVAVAAFDMGLRAEEILTGLIARDTTNGLDFASVSNAPDPATRLAGAVRCR